jgi:hypothetical protein
MIKVGFRFWKETGTGQDILWSDLMMSPGRDVAEKTILGAR